MKTQTPPSLFAIIFGKQESNLLPHQVVWDTFLKRLKHEDSTNVCSLITRLSEVNAQVPLGVVAVGSTLNNEKAYYEDIDLLLIPMHDHNIALAEVVFTDFARRQPETRKKGDTQEPAEYIGVYEATLSWYLDFGDNYAPIHLVIMGGQNNPADRNGRIILADWLEWERQRWKDYGPKPPKQRPFACYVFNED